jgi:hypothetical protein
VCTVAAQNTLCGVDTQSSRTHQHRKGSPSIGRPCPACAACRWHADAPAPLRSPSPQPPFSEAQQRYAMNVNVMMLPCVVDHRSGSVLLPAVHVAHIHNIYCSTVTGQAAACLDPELHPFCTPSAEGHPKVDHQVPRGVKAVPAAATPAPAAASRARRPGPPAPCRSVRSWRSRGCFLLPAPPCRPPWRRAPRPERPAPPAAAPAPACIMGLNPALFTRRDHSTSAILVQL